MLNIPKDIKTVQPVAHFIPGDNPYKDIQNAAADSNTSSKRLSKVIAQSGRLIWSFILRDENFHCNMGDVSIRIKGMIKTNIVIDLHSLMPIVIKSNPA
ncbi:hypothetical protein [Mucilaginibacter sp. NFX135]|uniref:hypothetical protein n=1 Tax=Mucilaginibacter sp. NFX135 TaxID=3402687 RepID=UPI003AFA326B